MADPYVTRPPAVVLAGCGAFAERFYLPALTARPALRERLALVDKNLERLKSLAVRFGAEGVFEDYEDLPFRPDAAVVALPHHLHYPAARYFLEKEIPVLCEKPLALSGEDARALVELAEEKGVPLMVNNTRRLFPASGEIKRLLDAGALGALLEIEYAEGGEFTWPTASGFYFSTPECRRGVLADKGAHILDLVCWWLGRKPGKVSCRTDSFGGPEGLVHVRFEEGKCRGDIRIDWLAKVESRFRIAGEAGVIEGIPDDMHHFVLARGSKRKKILPRSGAGSYWDLGRVLIDNFIGVLSGKAEPLVKGRDVLGSIEMIDTCYREAERFRMPWYERWTANHA